MVVLNATSATITALSGFLVNSTLSFTLLHLLLMTYMALPFLMVLIFFNNNEYVFYATLVMEGILWAIAIYSVITKIHEYPKLTYQLLSNVTSIARG
ncbi:hypothetical protein EYM_05585 [Ignicoccus islandicus DSM 13165]|uniref:Uncharacterized protein n=1 Tax=Ignicoccus islandicus DSM 13165 TaxID=940295 RepID=A0A0U3FL88_9CREN|nr:hypothetical protein [Ignicoccus islandicus]ALU12598.1 hypothetical protein EYM_05585 [Ignicoccus islandicus DSM 13165]